MALEDVGLKAMRKTEEKANSSESKIKSRAGLVINIFAALLAANTFINNGLSSTIMNNTIKANDLWNFYQAKSMKQTMYELAAADADTPDLEKKFLAKAASYESSPETREGKKELMEDALKLEAERDVAKKKTPWIAYAVSYTHLTLPTILLSILSASVYLFYGSFIFAISGIILMSQGILLWM